MIEMTLSSRHRIRNSSPGGLRPSTLPLGHGGSPQYWLSHVDGEETFLFFLQTAETGNRTPNSGVKGSGANHYPRAPAPISKGSTQQTQNICITFIQCRTNVEDVGPTYKCKMLYKCFVFAGYVLLFKVADMQIWHFASNSTICHF